MLLACIRDAWLRYGSRKWAPITARFVILAESVFWALETSLVHGTSDTHHLLSVGTVLVAWKWYQRRMVTRITGTSHDTMV